MVRGLDVFREFFFGLEENYIIIGGTACNIYEEEMQQEPRATKDIDMILIIEALSDAFVKRFWEFIIAGGYLQRQRGESLIEADSGRNHEYFRFIKPANKAFPKQIELFSRRLGLMNFPEGAHIAPIPMGEELSSLSAILMDDDYYYFTISHSSFIEGVHYASPESLICLKAKAFLDLKRRKAEGEDKDQEDIEKHKKDVFRMIPSLPKDARFSLPPKLAADVGFFLDTIIEELPGKEFFKAMNFPRLNAAEMVERLRIIFQV